MEKSAIDIPPGIIPSSPCMYGLRNTANVFFKCYTKVWKIIVTKFNFKKIAIKHISA